MTKPGQLLPSILRSFQRAVFPLTILCFLPMLAVRPAQAQTFTVLHNFTGGGDGRTPWVGVTMDRSGNLYGTTLLGGTPGGCGNQGCGVVFKLTHRNSSWVFAPLYTFSGGSDGALPAARVVFGPNGTLYGSTCSGGGDPYPNGLGLLFNLQPPAHASGRIFEPWTETVLYSFVGFADPNCPSGDLIFDAAGNIYGTSQSGGYECEDTVYCGTVFKLARSGNSWTESLLYAFTNGNVAIPVAGVVFDSAGNLYGTTTNGNGAVFQLAQSGSTWTENTIHYFGNQGDGWAPYGGVHVDAQGNLYGTTGAGGTSGLGVIYELTHLGGTWNETLLAEPGGVSTLVQDAAGNLYGTACGGGSNNNGSVFKLSHSGGSWVRTDLYDFTGGSDGTCPLGDVIVDSAGTIYGTTTQGGAFGYGVVFQLTQ